MQFELIAKAHNWWGIVRNVNITFSADNAEEAREIVFKRFPTIRRASLFQLLADGEKPKFFGQQYSRSWNWDFDNGWLRVLPGRRVSLSGASDEETDEDLTKDYLAGLS